MTLPSPVKNTNQPPLSCAARQLACAGLAYLSMLGGSIAAAATLVLEDIPALLLGV